MKINNKTAGFVIMIMAFVLMFTACDPMEGDFETIKELMGGGKPKVMPKVYVAGYYEENGVYQACYWVDGELISLNGREAKAVTVVEGKVYVAGTYGTTFPYNG
ncbi:MAG: hypothetical protein FWH38_06110, partial [Treponema sp.]|nr:hypothetical protein [Treponema sp.]